MTRHWLTAVFHFGKWLKLVRNQVLFFHQVDAVLLMHIQAFTDFEDAEAHTILQANEK